MKKLFAFLLILSVMLCAVGCEGFGDPEYAIKKAYIERIPEHMRDNYTPDDIQIWSYGTYNGCTVGYFGERRGGGQAITEEKVGNYVFIYPDTTTMLAYKDGQIKLMPEAYELGWLDDDAVKQIHEKHKQEDPVIYDLTPYTKAGAATVYGIEESVIDEYHKNYPKTYDYPAEDREFAEDRVIICVYPFANAHEFTSEDFSILQDAVNVQSIAVEPLANVSSDTQAEEPTRLLVLTLKGGSKSDVIDAIIHLQSRDDIYYAVPDVISSN